MTVTITIFHGGKPDPSILLTIGDDTNVPKIDVDSWVDVEASIALSADEEGGRFILKRGHKLGIEVEVSVNSGSEESFRYNGKPRFKLFCGGMGLAELLLVREEPYSEQKLTKVHVLNGKKEKLYKAMRQELLNRSLPHFLVDDLRGQQWWEDDHFSIGYKGGYVSCEDYGVMLEHLQRDINDITPFLKCIIRAPILHHETVLCRRPISAVSRISSATRKSIMRSSKCFNDMRAQDECICVSRKQVTTHIPVHSAIRTFLDEFILHRLVKIQQAFKDEVKGLTAKIAKGENDIKGIEAKIQVLGREGKVAKKDEKQLKRLKGELDKGWRKKGENVDLRNRISEKIESAESSIRAVQRFLRMPIFDGSREVIRIYDLSPADFMATDAYRNLYAKIARFSRDRYWWVGDDVSHSRHRIPQLKLDSAGENRLQNQYSIVYENWCYAQIFLAFLRLGYKYCDNEGNLKWATYGSCTLKNGKIKVKVIHDVKPQPTSETNGGAKGFYSKGEMTPDFALIVSLDGVDGEVWYVMDAKSDERDIKPHMVKAILKYCNKDFYYTDENGQQGRKIGVFLIRSGERENDGNNAKIEVPPRLPHLSDDDAKREGIRIEDFTKLYSADYFLCKGRGLRTETNMKREVPFIGYLRVNCFSKERERVFEEFVDEYLVNTAVSNLSKVSYGRRKG